MLRKLLLKRHTIGAALFPAAAAIGGLSLDDVTSSAEWADVAFLRIIRSGGCGLFFLFLAGCFRLGCSLCLGRSHLLQVGIGGLGAASALGDFTFFRSASESTVTRRLLVSDITSWTISATWAFSSSMNCWASYV